MIPSVPSYRLASLLSQSAKNKEPGGGRTLIPNPWVISFHHMLGIVNSCLKVNHFLVATPTVQPCQVNLPWDSHLPGIGKTVRRGLKSPTRVCCVVYTEDQWLGSWPQLWSSPHDQITERSIFQVADDILMVWKSHLLLKLWLNYILMMITTLILW